MAAVVVAVAVVANAVEVEVVMEATEAVVTLATEVVLVAMAEAARTGALVPVIGKIAALARAIDPPMALIPAGSADAAAVGISPTGNDPPTGIPGGARFRRLLKPALL